MFEDGFAGILRFQEFYKLFVSQSVESYTGSQMQSLFFVDSGVTKTEKAVVDYVCSFAVFGKSTSFPMSSYIERGSKQN